MGLWPFGKSGRRAKLRAVPFEPRVRALYAMRFRFWRWLTAEEREELERHALVLRSEKRFEAAGGFELTEDAKWLIVGQAALLLLHRQTDYFPGVDTFVVYPKAFHVPVRRALDGGASLEDEEERAGESWSWGTVVLAWDEVEEGLRHGDEDGYNVVLHELAHALDRENGEEDGMPRLESAAAEGRWAEVFTPAYEALCAAADREENPETFFDPYGAESPAEFFAVAVESFFESPEALREEAPALYHELALYFRQDPAAAARRARKEDGARVRRAKGRRPRLR